MLGEISDRILLKSDFFYRDPDFYPYIAVDSSVSIGGVGALPPRRGSTPAQWCQVKKRKLLSRVSQNGFKLQLDLCWLQL
jgi:hypothetical protein